MGLSLDATTRDYVESQRARLGSLTQSELVRDLLREHRALSEERDRLRTQVSVLSEQLHLIHDLRRSAQERRKGEAAKKGRRKR